MAKVVITASLVGKEAAIADLNTLGRTRAKVEEASVRAAQQASDQRIAIARRELEVQKSLLGELGAARAAANRRARASRPEREDPRHSPSALAIGAATSVMTSAISFVSNSLKQFGSFVIADVMRPMMQLKTIATQVANASGGKVTAAEVVSTSRAVALRNNIDPQELIKAAGTFQDLTGESKIGFELLSSLATIGKGRGFDIQQLASMAGSLYKPGMDAKGVEKLMVSMLAQGDIGSITLGEVSKLGGKITAPAGSFAGDYATRIATSGALLQSARKGFGSTDETATGLASFVTDMMKAGKRFDPKAIIKDASGVEMITDPAKLIANIYRKTGGAASALAAARLSEPTTKLIGAYGETYTGAFKAAKAGGATDAEAREKAATAVEDFIRGFITANTTMESEAAKRDAVMNTDAERFDSAINKIKDRLVALMPSITKFVDTLANNAPTIANAALVLAKALVALATYITSIVPKTDTRPAQRVKAMVENEEKRNALSAEIAAGEAAGGDVTAKRAELTKLIEESNAISAGGAIGPRLTREGVLAKIGDTELNRGILTMLEKDATGFDPYNSTLTTGSPDALSDLTFGILGGTVGGMTDEQKDALAAYRDQLLTKQEAGAQGVGSGVTSAVAAIRAAAGASVPGAGAGTTETAAAADTAAKSLTELSGAVKDLTNSIDGLGKAQARQATK